MKLDETLTRSLNEIQEEIKNEFGLDITIEQIHNIVETQIEATKLGIAKSLTVHWIRFGKFVFTDKYNNIKDIRILDEKLLNNEDLLPHEKIDIRKNLVINKAVERNNKIKKSSLFEKGIGSKSIGVNDLMTTPNVSKVKMIMFSALNNKHTKP